MTIAYCERCERYHVGGQRCFLFEVVCRDGDEEHRGEFWAKSHEDAAVKWARRYDARESDIVSDDLLVDVWQKAVGVRTRQFSIKVVVEPEYSAEEE
jgi:hypothetical protein